MLKVSISSGMLSIKHGYHCSSSCWCDKRKCKYRKGFKFHNFSVNVHRFFNYHFNINLPHLLYINRRYTDLSGTTKCPYGKSRFYTCYDCKYCGYDRSCNNPKYSTATYEELIDFIDDDWNRHCRCNLFEKSDYADAWDRDTGERVY